MALRQKLESRPMDTQELAKVAMTSSQFTPVPSTNCFGVKPCLHSTAADRLAAGCLDAVWDGTYGSGTKYKHVTLGNLSFEQPVAPTELERFHPRVGDVCDLSDIWQVSNLHRGHVKDAVEAHWHMRLRGLRDALWLSIGSSIDHGWIKVMCEGFGAPRTTSDPQPPTKAYPAPGLLIDYCHVQQLNLTFAHTNGGGIATTQTQSNEALQPERFAEIDSAVRKHVFKDATGLTRAQPTFLSFGGMEWDFKNWRCQYPKTQAEWRAPVATLKMQVEHARRQWPTIRVVFSRTMFQPTYGTFGCACCAVEAHFWHYNHLLRNRELNWPGGAGTGNAARREGSGGVRSAAQGAGGSSNDGVCAGIHVLDMQRMMLCNNSVGSCSSRTGWSVDGLHPSRAVLLQYVSLTMNTAADLGEHCRERK